MKRILIISQCFPPILLPESIMLLKKVRIFSQHFAITVVTLDNKHRLFPNDPVIERYIPSSVEVIRIPTFNNKLIVNRVLDLVWRVVFRSSGILRYYDLKWAVNASRFIKKKVLLNKTFDILMTNSQNICSHLVGYSINKILDIPWVQHYSDPFVDSVFRHYNFLSRRIDGWFEYQFYKRASIITLPSIEIKNKIFQKFGENDKSAFHRKTFVIPHTYDQTIMNDACTTYSDKKAYFVDGDAVHVCYVGNLYGPRSLQLILDIYHCLVPHDRARRIVVHIFGEMDRKSKKMLMLSTIPNVIFHGRVSYLESLAIMQYADFLLLIDTPVKQSPFFPSKLADYLGTQKPIIIIAHADSTVGRIAREFKLTLGDFEPTAIRVGNNIQDLDSLIEQRTRFSNRTQIYSELIEAINAT